MTSTHCERKGKVKCGQILSMSKSLVSTGELDVGCRRKLEVKYVSGVVHFPEQL